MNDIESNHAEFLRIIAQYDGVISRICYSYASSVSDFEDLRQDVCINIWRGLARFRQECNIQTWIYRICLNTCVTDWRRRSRQPSCVPLDVLADRMEQSPDDAERVATLHALISQLDKMDRAIILMWLDELPYDEIATVMGMGRNTIATRIRRIKEKLIKMADKITE